MGEVFHLVKNAAPATFFYITDTKRGIVVVGRYALVEPVRS